MIRAVLFDLDDTLYDQRAWLAGAWEAVAGADLVVEYLRGVLGLPIRPERLTYQSGVTMIRHFEEVFES